ncbi:hypothetical protein Aperf_G00000012464 [Anoplocephala perfoliata]
MWNGNCGLSCLTQVKVCETLNVCYSLGGEDSFKRRAAATLHQTCPSGPLSEMKKFDLLNVVVTSHLSATTTIQRKELQEFYDLQIQVAEMFGSAAEFKFWLLRWFQQLVIESMVLGLAGY